MSVNFSGSEPPAPAAPPAGRTLAVILGCFGAAAVLAALVFAVAVQQHRAPSSAPPIVGVDRALAAAAPAKPAAPAPADHWVLHAAAQPAAPAAPSPASQPPQAQDPAAAKARMIAALRQVPHGTITLVIEDDGAAEAYARKLADLFREAGWTVEQSSAFGSGAARRGLAAALGVSPADEAVREAFDAVGFQFEPPPRDAGVIRTPEIFVGAPYGAGR